MNNIENIEFPLSQKYIDFIKYNSSAEFLEGTTFAGKTTVGAPKFMFKVAQSPKRLHIIAGRNKGVIEQNIINRNMGLTDIFGDLIEYNPSKKGKNTTPHIIFHTGKEDKVIYILGYDDKSRWKNILGGQFGCIMIDEFNIADMDFIREIFMRCDYRLCTMNPDDPSKECYTQYVNYSRPIEKYKDDAPGELLKMLNEPPKSDWAWWYFSFDHNASLQEEKRREIVESVPKETKLYKNKIQGLRGKATGLVFNLESKDIITQKQAIYEDWQEKEPKIKRNFVKFSIGADTSYSKQTHDKITFEFTGITDKGECFLLEEETHNNKDRTTPFAPSDVIPKLVAFAEMCKNKWGFAKTIYIDSADTGTIQEAQKYKRATGCIYDFVGAWKKTTNITRVQLQQSWLTTNHFKVVETCKNYINECDVYSYDEDGKLEDANDHSIQGCQYSWLPHKRLIGDWSIIKVLIKDADD